jgi:L,D-peptidoglycan transpeptidase YkuD (ErfK/YbiS/YcfS/YnhG family)
MSAPVDLIVTSDGWLEWPGGRVRCALGPSGVKPAAEKREGDGATPAGAFPIRRVLYRPDRGGAPKTALPVKALERDDGWCEVPGDPNYNKPIKLPYPASAESMWREDHLYDLVVVIGHNDDPVVPGLGSAVFFHLARPDYSPTQGCFAVSRPDMEKILAVLEPGSRLIVKA